MSTTFELPIRQVEIALGNGIWLHSYHLTSGRNHFTTDEATETLFCRVSGLEPLTQMTVHISYRRLSSAHNGDIEDAEDYHIEIPELEQARPSLAPLPILTKVASSQHATTSTLAHYESTTFDMANWSVKDNIALVLQSDPQSLMSEFKISPALVVDIINEGVYINDEGQVGGLEGTRQYWELVKLATGWTTDQIMRYQPLRDATKLWILQALHEVYQFTPANISRLDNSLLYSAFRRWDVETVNWLIDTFRLGRSDALSGDGRILRDVEHLPASERRQMLNILTRRMGVTEQDLARYR